MRKKYISRDILVLSILTLITVLTWIGLDVYRILTRKEEPYVPPGQLISVNPKIDKEIIDQIAQESVWEKGEYLPPQKTTGEEGGTD